MPQKILVTGGAGFIGSHLTDSLIKKGHKVVVVDNLSTPLDSKHLTGSTGKKENLNPKAKFYKVDICSPKIAQIFKKEKPQIVFHYAAQIDVRKSIKNPFQDAEINILGSLNVIQNFCQLSKVKSQKSKFIFASTGGAIYGDTGIIPTLESQPAKPESPYGMAKLLIEQYLAFYKKTYDLDYVSLRYANVYGPRQNSKGEAGVVAIFIDKLLDNKRPTIFGDGTQTRDFLYVDDAVEAGLKTLTYRGQPPVSVSSEPIFNVGTGVETSVNELYKLISQKLKKDIKPNLAPAKPGDLKRSCLDYSKIKKDLNWQPKYDLDRGLIKTIAWFKRG